MKQNASRQRRSNSPAADASAYGQPSSRRNERPAQYQMRDHSLYFSDACSSPPAKLSDQWRKTMRNRARLFILLALAPIIIGLAGFDSNAEARHRRWWRDVGFNRFGPCCQAPCPVACPAPVIACPAPVISCPVPAPVISCPVPAPVISCPAPAPVISWPAPAPVISFPAPVPVFSCPVPTSGFINTFRFRRFRRHATDWDD